LRSEAYRIERRLLSLAALFVLLLALALSLSPAARARSWEVDYRWSHWLGLLLWAGCTFAAHWQINRRLPERDPYLLPIAALLSGWGLLSVWRLAPVVGLRQSLWLFISMAVFIAGLRFSHDLGFLRRYKYVWLTSGLLLTALTLFLGTNPLGYGPRLWLGCCGLYLQPSEPLKLLLVVYLAAYLSGLKPDFLTGFRASLLPLLAPTLLMTGLAMALLLAQRDLGTASIFIFLYIMVVFVATGDRRILIYGGLILLFAGVAGYALFDVVRLRVDAWLNPWLDPSGRSYQIVQSLLAVANGGLFGRGPGLGNPTLVPISHSDFIFAAITEEHGLMGALGMLILIGLLAQRGLRIALSAPDAYRRYLAAGLSAHLAGQSILIIGGNLRLLPLTGVTLPFVSYGGSSLFTSFLSLLLLVHISNREEQGVSTRLTVNSRPYLGLGAFLLLGLAAAGLTAGWWTAYRGPDLLTRSDNARRSIADLSVKRGSILDRNSLPLAQTLGEPGAYYRQTIYPDLSPVIGYSVPIYGQAGLEAGLDPYLRGLRGNSGISIWWNHLLYGQPPPGLDARLTLDISLQQQADAALGDHSGALVLLDARNGEILAMASHPTFNANQVEENWQMLVNDPRTPLVNRATQRSYPLGDLQGLLLPQGAQTAGLALPAGLYLPVAAPPQAEDTLHLSPLQAALSAAGLSNAGQRPAPVFVQAVNTPNAGWVMLPPAGSSTELYTPAEASVRTQALRLDDQLVWQKTAVAAGEAGKRFTWYVGGTLPIWNGTPLSLAVQIEGDDPTLAEQIGLVMLRQAMMP
jgi:cell division protein FtsW (lipid II flippase)